MKIRKILVSIFCLLFFNTLTTFANEIDRYIKESDIGTKSILGVYITDEDGVLYKENEQKLLNPASILKVLTFGAAYETLGKNYQFETAIYREGNDLYVKLGCDTLLTEDDLVELFEALKTKYDVSKINNIYIDDSIIEKVAYPDSWMKEDMWPNERAITPYIIDKNYTKITLKRSSLATKVDIIQDNDYKIPIINELKPGDTQDVKIERLYGEDSFVINFKGTVQQDEIIKIPVLNPQINFNIKLKNAIVKNDINYFKKISIKKTPQNAAKVASVSHNIEDVSKEILYNSDNFASEIIFKAAAAKFIKYAHPATSQDAVEMFYSVYGDIIPEGTKIADGSGVSRYNLIDCKFAVNALKFLNEKNNIKYLMASSGEGTLKNRMPYLEGNLKAKTGTLLNNSSILGTLETLGGKQVAFCVIIQNSPKRKAVLKNFENNLITILYRKY